MEVIDEEDSSNEETSSSESDSEESDTEVDKTIDSCERQFIRDLTKTYRNNRKFEMKKLTQQIIENEDFRNI